MTIQKLQSKHIIGILAIIAVVIFLIEFVITWVEHAGMDKYREKMTERTYDVRDLNVYKRIQSTKEQQLGMLQRRYTLVFARSELKAALEKAAEISGIPVNDVSIEWDRSGETGAYKTIQLTIRINTTFPRAGAFISILEGALYGEQVLFPYAASIQYMHIAAIRQTGREVSAKIQLIVYQKA